MATTEDILEQLVEEFLIHRGYFVRHNVKFLPRKDHADFSSKLDSNHSDIDVLAFNPRRQGPAPNPPARLEHHSPHPPLRGRTSLPHTLWQCCERQHHSRQ